jgi:hypothetical protein
LCFTLETGGEIHCLNFRMLHHRAGGIRDRASKGSTINLCHANDAGNADCEEEPRDVLQETTNKGSG